MVESFEQEKDFRDKVFKRDQDVVAREIVGETILVPIRGKLADLQRIFTLNEVGVHIWSNLDGNKDLRAICQGLETAFDVRREQAEADLAEFISELEEAELIVGGT